MFQKLPSPPGGPSMSGADIQEAQDEQVTIDPSVFDFAKTNGAQDQIPSAVGSNSLPGPVIRDLTVITAAELKPVVKKQDEVQRQLREHDGPVETSRTEIRFGDSSFISFSTQRKLKPEDHKVADQSVPDDQTLCCIQ
jgi:hypothetical protein